jgi:beta-lactamase regulating signal transducer with metallopeptidase domain
MPTIIPASADVRLVPLYTPPQATVVQLSPPKFSQIVIPTPVKPDPIPWRWWVMLGWFAGCCIYLSYLAIAYFSLTLLGHRSAAITDPQWAQLLDEAKQRMNFHRPIRLMQSTRRSMPMIWGIGRTSILLPADATDWPQSQRRAVLLHEIAHARRLDCLTQLLVQLACALHWFNPLIWLNWKWMQIEREKACDDLVLTAGAKASAYAEQLLQIASQRRGGSTAAIAMARRSSIEGRLLAILDAKRNRRAISWTAAVIALMLMATIAAPLAMLRAQEASREPAKVIKAATTQPTDDAGTRERAIAVENAKRHFDDVEKQYKAGLVTRLEYETADWDLKIAKAHLSSDPVEEMIQRRLAADAMLKTTKQLYEAGLVPESKLHEAQGNAKLQRAMLDWQLDDPTWAAKWRSARVVVQAAGSTMELSQHNLTLSLQQGTYAIVADRMIIHTVAGDVCFAYVPFDYAGYHGLQLTNLNTGLTFQADLIEFNPAGELIVDHKVATTQMASNSGPPATAPVQTTGSLLSFCIAASLDASIDAPNRNRLPTVLAKQYIADLEQNGPQRVAGFIWCEASSDEELGTVVAGTHAGKRYVLLSEDPAQSMLTDRTAPRAWGLTQVRPGVDLQGDPILNFTFDSAGAELFGKLTESNLHQPLAMLIDKRVMTVATIQAKIGHEGVISFGGNVTPEQVKKLAGDLAKGMPAQPAATPATTQAARQMTQSAGSKIVFSLHNDGLRAQSGDTVIDSDQFEIVTVTGERCRVIADADRVVLTNANNADYRGHRHSASGSRIVIDGAGGISALGDVMMTTTRPTATVLPALDRELVYQQIAAADNTMRLYLRQRKNDLLALEALKSRGIGSNHPAIETAEKNQQASNQRIEDYAQEYLQQHPGFPEAAKATAKVSEAFVMGSVKHAGPTTLPSDGVITLKQLVDTAEPDSADAEVALHRNGVVTKYRLKDIREVAADNLVVQSGDVLVVSDGESSVPTPWDGQKGK